MPLEPRPVNNFVSCENHNAQYGEENNMNVTVQHADTVIADTVYISGSNNTFNVQAKKVVVSGHGNVVNNNSNNTEIVHSEEANAGSEVEDSDAETTVAQSGGVFEPTDVTTESDVVDRWGNTVQLGNWVWIAPRRRGLYPRCFGFYVGGGHVVTVLFGEHEVKQINVSGHSEFTIVETCGHLSVSYSRTEICGRCSERLGHRYNDSDEFVNDVLGR